MFAGTRGVRRALSVLSGVSEGTLAVVWLTGTDPTVSYF